MNITFGICTNNPDPYNIHLIINSIENLLNLKNYEIIVVGGVESISSRKNTKWINFNENIKSGWITRKKNIITEKSIKDYIVYLHDYIYFSDKEWLKKWESILLNESINVGINKVATFEGFRHADWMVDPYLLWENFPNLKDTYNVALPYNIRNIEKIQYISGGFWIAKKSFMELFPLNEDLVWGQAEDIDWSKSIRSNTKFTFNDSTFVQLMKPNKWASNEIPQNQLNELITRYQLSPIYI